MASESGQENRETIDGVIPDCGHNFRHGWHRTRLYRIWVGLRHRCRSTSRDNMRYGGRGIDVCEEWNDFLKFKEWSLEHGYDREKTIDRIDNDKGYYPNNCRWTTSFIQSRNRCDTIFVEHDGMRICITDWCKRLGVKRSTVYYRRRKGITDFHELFFGCSDRSRTVICRKLSGELVGEYHSGTQAAKALGINAGSVYRNCNGETSRVGPYHFSFKE